MNEVSGSAVSGAVIKNDKTATPSPSPTPKVVIEDDTGKDSRVLSSPYPVYVISCDSNDTAIASGVSVRVENLQYIEQSLRWWNTAGYLFIALLFCFLFYKFFNIFF